MLIKELSLGLKHLLFPNLCEGCQKPLVLSEDVICLSCEAHLGIIPSPYIEGNETAIRLSGRIRFQYAASLSYFTDGSLLQHLIHGLKYRQKRHIGVFLGKKLGYLVQEQGWGIDVIVPVPIHKKKESVRGYNQSDYIGKGVSTVLNAPIITGSVIRRRFTESQTHKTREERIDNVQGAFTLVHSNALAGKHVLLVDDVLTTGATIEACASVLLAVPGVTLSVATVGIAA